MNNAEGMAVLNQEKLQSESDFKNLWYWRTHTHKCCVDHWDKSETKT